MLYRVDIQNTGKTDRVADHVNCPVCNRPYPFVMRRIQQTAKIFWIPFLKYSSQQHAQCLCCGTRFALRPGEYRAILRADEDQACFLLEKAAAAVLYRKQQIHNIYAEKSEKNVLIAAFLAFFLSILGAQNLYLGHFRRAGAAIAMTVVSILSVLLMIVTHEEVFVFIGTIPLCVNVYWGIIDAVRILAGMAKDGKGRYLMTTSQYRRRVTEL